MNVDSQEFIQKWMNPYYPSLMHCKWARTSIDAEKPYFVSLIEPALNEITEPVVEQLLNIRDWRAILTGSWFAGVKGWSQFTEQIGKFLGGSYAQSGVCFALACFANEQSVQYLTLFIDKYIDRKIEQATSWDFWNYYAINWPIAALYWIDRDRGYQADRQYFLATKNEPERSNCGRFDLLDNNGRPLFAKIMEFSEQWF
jgi:Family of unknown function (DUF6000)